MKVITFKKNTWGSNHIKNSSIDYLSPRNTWFEWLSTEDSMSVNTSDTTFQRNSMTMSMGDDNKEDQELKSV